MDRQIRDLRELDRKKDEALATLGHELRSPLAALMMNLELLRQEQAGPTAVLDSMARQLGLIGRLADDLTEAARIAHGGATPIARKPQPLQPVILEAVNCARRLIEQRRHHLRVELPRDPVTAFVDGGRLQQIVVNLLTNAARYTDPGGRITLSLTLQGREVVLAVEDDGQGISAEALPLVFEPFQRFGRGSGNGMGLGLALVKRFVELHGGTVQAWSGGPGCGSRFSVSLPLPSAGEEDGDEVEGSETGSFLEDLACHLTEPVDPVLLGGWLGDIRPLVTGALGGVGASLCPRAAAICARLARLVERSARDTTVTVDLLAEAEWLRGDLLTCVRVLRDGPGHGSSVSC